jgi:PKD repeat protein
VCSDLESDFTHPTATGGVPKVATQLLAFFKSDATATPWFLRHTVTGAPPSVTASADFAGGYAPLAVNFSASATDPDGTIVGYQWTFGDGTFSTAQSPAKTFRSPGIHEVHLTVTDNSGNTAHATVSLTVKLSFAEWRRIYFTAAELDDQQISGALADPDTDGLANLAEYACGSHPKMADAAVFTARRTDGQLTLTYPRAKHAADVTITVEAASNLAGPWNSAAGSSAEQVLADDGVVETVVATDLAPSNGQRFLRLRIDRISPASSTVKRP